MKYENYTVWDFIEDDYFVSWVKEGHDQTDQFWDKWLSQNTHKYEEVQLARYILTHIQYDEKERPTEKELVDAFENIVRTRQRDQKSKLFGKQSFFTPFLRYVAVILMAFSTVFCFWYFASYQPEKVVSGKVAMIEKNNPRGMKTTILLSDGTKVKLNSETSLRYPEYFSDSIRIVYLEGEAFFEVERDESKPFIVISKGIRTKVLGTSFDVRAYPEEGELRVGVVEGKVQVTGDEKSGVILDHQLRPNQITVIDFDKKTAHKTGFNPDELTAWTSWVLKFKNRPLKSIFHEIEKWYAIEVVAGSDIDLTQSFSGSFENEPLNAVLEILSHNAEFDFKISGKQVTITKKLIAN
ncbi:FecR domain-containing protein [Reichenbachiella sp. MALMAid0571]|uniref:FecR family protein n=1 Tax=Reichenbachiella sp. MALMAid0571 TaxID=3143939 RepID=UPI0032E04FDA